MRALVICMLTLLASITVSAQATLPSELAELEQFADQPFVFLEAVRNFDLEQQALYEWDAELINLYANNGQSSLITTKRDDMRRRLMLVETAWVYFLQYYPNSPQGNNYYGEYLYDYTPRRFDAVQQWRRALGMDEKLAAAHNNIGLHYLHTGNLRSALRHLERAIELEPKNPDFLFNAAQMYLTYFPEIEKLQKRSLAKIYAQAMRYSKEATLQSPDEFDLLQDYAVNFYAAENFGETPDWKEATKAWKNVRLHAQSKQDRYYAFLNEARVWRRMEAWDEAIPLLEEAIRIRPDRELPRTLLEETREQLSSKSSKR